MMTNAIDYFNSQSLLRSLASRVALHARRRIYGRFIALAGTEPGRRLLDLGVTPDTRLPDSNFLERWYPHTVDITMASIEDCTAIEAVFAGTRFVQIAPDQALPFPDASFDIGFSSAVLEHVGGAAQQRFFLQELLWNVSSPGMEFTSELLVNALRAGAKIVEAPITLRRDRRDRPPHLHTRRDGMRHLLTILARAPWLFLHIGLAIVGLSVLLATMCAFGPRVVFGKFAVFDYHTLIFAALLGFLGTQALGTGLLLRLRQPRPPRGLVTRLLDLHEGVLFWLLAGITVGVVGGVGFVAWSWAQHGFVNIAYPKFTLFLLYIATVIGSLGMSLFYTHLLKRA